MTHYKMVLVDVLDADGEPTGRSVPVDVCYEVVRDSGYGADADGNRGIVTNWIEPTMIEIASGDLAGLTPAQIERVKEDAVSQVERG